MYTPESAACLVQTCTGRLLVRGLQERLASADVIGNGTKVF